MGSKTEYGSADGPVAILYAKDDADAREAFPVLRSDLNPGLSIPKHDELAFTYSGTSITQVVYLLSAVSVATLTIAYSGSTLTGITKV
jgi:hypothetical protein